MAIPQFQVGDKVQLLSGGPAMTVEQVLDGDRIYCVWFHNTEHRREPFPAATLKKI